MDWWIIEIYHVFTPWARSPAVRRVKGENVRVVSEEGGGGQGLFLVSPYCTVLYSKNLLLRSEIVNRLDIHARTLLTARDRPGIL